VGGGDYTHSLPVHPQTLTTFIIKVENVSCITVVPPYLSGIQLLTFAFKVCCVYKLTVNNL